MIKKFSAVDYNVSVTTLFGVGDFVDVTDITTIATFVNNPYVAAFDMLTIFLYFYYIDDIDSFPGFHTVDASFCCCL